MSKVAIVIMYDGAEPNDNVKSKIGNILTQSSYCDCTKDVNIYFVTEKELVQAIASKPTVDVINEHFYNSDDVLSEQERALICIAEHCQSLKSTGDVNAFQMELSIKFANAYYRNQDFELINAVRIIAKDKSLSCISPRLKKLYHFHVSHYNVVRTISDAYV